MNKAIMALVLAGSAVAAADTAATAPTAKAPAVSPWGSSPAVVAYTPPAIAPEESHAHRGLTLEGSLLGGTTSRDTSAGGGAFALGFWVTPDVALAFRVTSIGNFGFVGASVQYEQKDAHWFLGAGAGQLIETYMDYDGYSNHSDAAGGFARVGYNFTQGDAHALYISGEIQGGNIQDRNRVTGFIALGYQML
ncbi:hypothetical protein BH11MYX2_BH11MYX2_27670 [soil metagenome]